ncbi:ankyrin repeat domain-containing protein [Paenibacillus sp. sptzw28]|uniref:ankyrin repeat domain-containing protein n=1 Tax=Paenibacillus sp. sptzw28 TaxID=715179 RepID=UPI001C6EE354|nr:ankyrin repeat domain-containing protein [Paenibacillus sp. sptzw28]QYR22295.1 ankyrin repeat domain-containing protein [Paenibacillus sp. sptzw28]
MEPKHIFNGFDLSAIEENMRKTFVYSLLGNSASLQALLSEDPGAANFVLGYFTPIHFAVRSGHSDSVRLLLKYGADITGNPIGWSDDPLTKANDRGYREIAEILKQHLDSNFRVSPTGSKLANLIKEGRIDEALRELDNSPGMINAGDERGNTPIHWAVLTRDLRLIDSLIQRGADLRAKRADGATPLQVSIEGDYWFRNGRDLSVKALRNEWFLAGYLIARGAEYDIWTAASVGDSRQVASFLQEDPSLVNTKNSVGKRPLSYAAKYGNAVMVKLLLEYGADPNAEERNAPNGSALWAAVKDNCEECVQLLLEHGADPNAVVESGGNCLFIAMRKGHHSLAKLLYTYGASMSLDAACSLGRIDLAGEIIAANPSSVNFGGDYGPLCMAVANGDMDIVKLLMRNGADLNAPWYANNYMGYAVDQGPEMLRFLLESGADPNNANWLGITYLHKAAWLGSLEFARLLIEFGADLNAVDEEYHSTPLGWAAKYGQSGMVRYLLDKGADPRLPVDQPWAQPISWARRKGYSEIADILAVASTDTDATVN